jgi:hypothetical protein
MNDPTTLLSFAGFGLAGLAIALGAGLKGWQGWLDLKRLELASGRAGEPRSQAMERIEIADMKERIRKLEAIASCVDL